MSVKLLRWAAGIGDVIELGAGKNVSSAGGGGGGVATATLANNGNWTGSVSPGGTGAFSETWITPTASAGNAYESRMTVNSGGFTSGNTGVWEALGTTRSWTCVGAASVNATLEIRRASDSVVLDSVSVLMNGS